MAEKKRFEYKLTLGKHPVTVGVTMMCDKQKKG